MSDLPTPAGLGGNKNAPLGGGIKVEALEFKEREFGKHLVEFGKKGDQLIFHFFNEGVYPMSFRGRLYGAFSRHLNFNGRERELLDIDWVEEFNSWCVIVKNVAQLSPPPTDDDIEELLKAVFS